jgi:myo-inositol 2-dehydrogenase / D-chiro-inositol 1-dehydrogenase
MGQPVTEEPASDGRHARQGPVIETVRVGVVGAGAMGTSHIRTLSTWVPGAVVAQVFDADIARAKDVAAEVGATAADSAEALISSDDVDAVLIAAPDPLHAELTLACVAAGRPTLCEKPLATSASDSRRVVDAEVALGRRLIQVGFMRRYDPAFAALRDLVAEGGIGEVRVAHCVHRNPRAHPTATSDGIVGNSMIHELDSVPWVLDSPLTAITVLSPRVPDGVLRDPQIAVLETASGVLVTVEVFVNAGYGYDVQCEVVGDAGTAWLTPPYGIGRRQTGFDGVAVSADFIARFADAYRVELHAWVDSVRSGVATGPSAWDGHVANLAAAAGVESLHSTQRVAIAVEQRPELYR